MRAPRPPRCSGCSTRVGRTLQRYPQLLTAAAAVSDAEADHDRHQAVSSHLDRLLTRGQQSGEFVDDLDTAWLATAVIALGHAAGDAVSTGRMTLTDATTTLARSVLRICGVQSRMITQLIGSG